MSKFSTSSFDLHVMEGNVEKFHMASQIITHMCVEMLNTPLEFQTSYGQHITSYRLLLSFRCENHRV